jgi:ATP phosphoribosyltransferase
MGGRKKLTFALSKGRLADKIFKMLKEINLVDITIDEENRRFIIEQG